MNRQSLPIALLGLVLAAVVASGCGSPAPKPSPEPTSTPEPTPTPTPTPEPTPTPPTYSEVLKTFRPGEPFCTTIVYLQDVLRNGTMLLSTTEKGVARQYGPKNPLIRCVGTRIIVAKKVKLEGKTYRRGDLLTVDKDMNWILLSSWD